MHFVHTADNHLDIPLGSLPPHKAILRRKARLASFSRIIDYTLAHGDMLLISGDLFHSPTPSQSMLDFCTREFERLGTIPVFIASGNHDYGLNNYNFPGNVRVFSPKGERIRYKDCIITGISFSSASAFLSHVIPPAEEKDAINILCIHGDMLTQSEYNPLNKEVISALGYDYIALGHIHEHMRYKNIVYPGCHDGSGFDETGEKCFIYGEVDKTHLSITPVKSSSLVYKTVNFDISDYASSVDIANALTEAFEDGIYKINLTGTPKEGFCPNNDAIEAYISENFFHAVLTDATSPEKSWEDSILYKLFSQYITSHCDEKTTQLALRYGIEALNGGNEI